MTLPSAREVDSRRYLEPVWGRKPIGRRQELTKRGKAAQGVVVRTFRRSQLIDGNWFTRAYAEVAYQTPWGQRIAIVRGAFHDGDAVRLLYDKEGAMQAPDQVRR